MGSIDSFEHFIFIHCVCAFIGLSRHLKFFSLLKAEMFLVLFFRSTLGREFKFLIAEKCVVLTCFIMYQITLRILLSWN